MAADDDNATALLLDEPHSCSHCKRHLEYEDVLEPSGTRHSDFYFPQTISEAFAAWRDGCELFRQYGANPGTLWRLRIRGNLDDKENPGYSWSVDTLDIMSLGSETISSHDLHYLFTETGEYYAPQLLESVEISLSNTPNAEQVTQHRR